MPKYLVVLPRLGGLTVKLVNKFLQYSLYKINKKGGKIILTKYIYNKNAFNKIVTEEDAYWLGFILADGYVSHET